MLTPRAKVTITTTTSPPLRLQIGRTAPKTTRCARFRAHASHARAAAFAPALSRHSRALPAHLSPPPGALPPRVWPHSQHGTRAVWATPGNVCATRRADAPTKLARSPRRTPRRTANGTVPSQPARPARSVDSIDARRRAGSPAEWAEASESRLHDKGHARGGHEEARAEEHGGEEEDEEGGAAGLLDEHLGPLGADDGADDSHSAVERSVLEVEHAKDDKLADGGRRHEEDHDGRRGGAHLRKELELVEDGAEYHAAAHAEQARGDGPHRDDRGVLPHLLVVPLHIALGVAVAEAQLAAVIANEGAPRHPAEAAEDGEIEKNDAPVAERAALDAQQRRRTVAALEEREPHDDEPRAAELQQRAPWEFGLGHQLGIERPLRRTALGRRAVHLRQLDLLLVRHRIALARRNDRVPASRLLVLLGAPLERLLDGALARVGAEGDEERHDEPVGAQLVQEDAHR
mmetsp:Transcript_24673/g.65068  ORF Transcript_24673/g.65068 Transcript_24673/m.65068 type:complete len:461 (-) Transcript_24673:169-1551(-)